jgi:hypothetical protein
LGKGTAEALFAVDRELLLLMNVSEFKAELLKLAYAIETRFWDLLQLECGVIGYSLVSRVWGTVASLG